MFRLLLACCLFAASGLAVQTIDIQVDGETIVLPVPPRMQLADPDSEWVKDFVARRKAAFAKMSDAEMTPAQRNAPLSATFHGHEGDLERYIFVSPHPLGPSRREGGAAFFREVFPLKDNPSPWRYGDRYRIYWLEDNVTVYAMIQCRGKVLRCNLTHSDDGGRAKPFLQDAESFHQWVEDVTTLNPSQSQAQATAGFIGLSILIALLACCAGYVYWLRRRAQRYDRPPPLPSPTGF